MPAVSANRFLPALRQVVLVRESADCSDGQLLSAFLRDRDGDAFAVIVRRHGPMVLGVCRRVTGNAEAAEDAFQAVFLILARRAGAVRARERVASWLYGVAVRTAMKARSLLARRRTRERQVEIMPEPPVKRSTLGSAEWIEVQAVIDEELCRLPERLRLPMVLCDLEGRPQRSAAKQLGLPAATLAARLAEARRLLAARLTRRGITLSGGALAAVLGERASAAAIAPKLAQATVRAAEAIVGGSTSALAGLVSGPALQLCEGVMRMMLLSKLKTMATTSLAVLSITCGLGFGLHTVQADDPKMPELPPARATRPIGAPVDDATYLRRICLELTGQLPSAIEMSYFSDDPDAKKRRKVVDWLTASEAVRDYLANRDQPKSIEANADYKSMVEVYYKHLHQAARKQRFEETLREVEHQAYGRGSVLGDFDNDGQLDLYVANAKEGDAIKVEVRLAESDAEFLKRVVQSARGSAPTTLEEKYFLDDQDPKKREKLLDLILKDPAVAKKVGDDWKMKMLDPYQTEMEKLYRVRVALALKQDRFAKLVNELLEAKKTDEQILEAVTLATVGRLPTSEERRATLAVIGTAQDRKAAWVRIARSLAATPDGQKK